MPPQHQEAEDSARSAPLRVALAALGAFGLIGLGTAAIWLSSLAGAEMEGEQPLPVAVIELRRDDGIERLERHTGLIEAARETELAFDLGGQIAEMLAEEGDRVAAGGAIARLDTARLDALEAELEAEIAVLEARRELARRTLDRQAALEADGHVSAQRLDEARLSLAEIEASIRRIRAGLDSVAVDLGKSTLTAPYAGRIGAMRRDDGATIAAGQPIAMLIEVGRPRLRVSVPARAAAALQPGQVLPVALNGARLDATLAAIRPDIDPVTRGRLLLLDLPGESGAVIGETAALLLPRAETAAEQDAFWLPMTALREGADGLWTVMSLAKTETGYAAKAESVEILASDAERVLVRGTLRAGEQVIATGTHRLAPGTPVAPAPAAHLALGR